MYALLFSTFCYRYMHLIDYHGLFRLVKHHYFQAGLTTCLLILSSLLNANNNQLRLRGIHDGVVQAVIDRHINAGFLSRPPYCYANILLFNKLLNVFIYNITN